ncbi:MAG: uridine kinase [Paludibacteraceae bacterium]|nr:uridine kinase [Paludibacteraceae bacterium]
MKPIVIGIAGGTGSGKTTLAKTLYETFHEDAVMLCYDYYYRNNPDMPIEDRAKLNYDHPNAFETELAVKHLRELKEGKTIKHPTYDFRNHLRADEWRTLSPKRIVLFEGILVFENEELCDLMDIKLFVDTDADVRFVRRLTRDIEERARTMDSVVNQYLTTVKPMHEMFVEPSKRRADLIIPQGGKNQVAVGMVIDAITKMLQSK